MNKIEVMVITNDGQVHLAEFDGLLEAGHHIAQHVWPNAANISRYEVREVRVLMAARGERATA